MIEEHIAKIGKRIMRLEDRGAVYDGENHYWSYVDKNGNSRFFDDDGLPLS